MASTKLLSWKFPCGLVDFICVLPYTEPLARIVLGAIEGFHRWGNWPPG